MHLISTFVVLLASSLFVAAGLPDYCMTTWTCTTAEISGTVTNLTWYYPLCNGNDVPAFELLNGATIGSYVVSASCPPGSLCIGKLVPSPTAGVPYNCTISDFGGAPDCFVQTYSQFALPSGTGVVTIPRYTPETDSRGCTGCKTVCVTPTPATSTSYFNVGLIPFSDSPFCDCATTDGCNVQIATYSIQSIVG